MNLAPFFVTTIQRPRPDLFCVAGPDGANAVPRAWLGEDKRGTKGKVV